MTHKDPLPAIKACFAFQCRDTSSNRGGETTDEDGEHVEGGHALLDFSSNIPSRDEICTGGEESSLEKTKDGTADS